MPRSKRKREAGTTPPPPSRRRGTEREVTGAEPAAEAAAVGRKNDEIDSEAAAAETKISAMEDKQKDPLEFDQSNNPPDNNVEKDQGNGYARNGTLGGEGNDHAEPLKENASVPQHKKEQIQADAADATTSSTEHSIGGKQINSKSAGKKLDSRIQAVLTHRKMLLSSLERGRDAVQKRLDFAYKKNPAAKDQTDEQEIIAFQMLAKEATSLARKTKVDTDGEKRTSVSLRRGSSVGKKMNAALSSLAPGTASMAAAAAAAAAIGSAPDAAPAVPAPAPVSKPAPSANVKSNANATPAVSVPSVPVSQVPAPVSITVPKKSALAKTASKLSRPATSPRMTPAPGIPPPFSHTNLLGTPSRVAQPIANVPDCILLREKRRSLRNKIAALEPPENEHSASQDKSRKSFETLRRARQSLPPRRKTHWDCLLEEMRWMATDFKQERNWKVAMAHTLSKDFRERDNAIPGSKKQSETHVLSTELAATESAAKTADGAIAMEEDSHEVDQINRDGRPVASKLSTMVASFFKEYGPSSAITRDAATAEPQNAKNSENEQKPGPLTKLRNPDETEREALYEIVTEIAAKAKKSNRLTRSAHCKVEGTQLQLSNEQSKVLHLLEEKLSTTGSGAIFEGSYSSGKTVVTLALLSRTNGDGPHLIICSTESIVKWVDRAQYFEHIQVRSLASVLSSGAVLEENDVVVCDHAGLDLVNGSLPDAFKSIVVDCRHPWGFRGSKWSVKHEDTNDLALILSKFVPKEIVTASWWTQLSALGSKTCSRRLVIENKSSESLAGIYTGLGEKAKLDLLALRIGFVSRLVSNTKGEVALPKLLIGWARKRVKGLKSANSKFERVVRQLCEFLDSFACHLSSSEIIDEVPDGFSFDVQKCDMTETQRNSYEKKCNESRRILSAQVDELVTDGSLLEQAASCLLSLRRTCIHSELDSLLQSSLVQSALYMQTTPGRRKDSSSQPNQELASRIMECSGKMSHLASFLSGESSVTLSKETQNLVWKKEGKRKSAKVKHSPVKNKVVILAALPEVQLLVSLFLHSLGIDHEYIPDEFGNEQSANDFQGGSSYCWMRGQARLTGFNHQNVDDPAATNVVVCSPTTIAGDHGGVGADTSDAVICIDEDWSGRGELLFDALLYRFWCASNKKCKFIKLVAGDTLEEQFLAAGEFGILEQSDLTWQVSPLGVFAGKSRFKEKEASKLVSMLQNRGKPESWFGFPGLNLVASANEALSEVLSTSSPLKRKFGSSGPLSFFPSDEDSALSFVKVVMEILHLEGVELSQKLLLFPSASLVQTRSLLRRLDLGSSVVLFGGNVSLDISSEPNLNKDVKLGIPCDTSQGVNQPMDIDEFEPEEGPSKVPGASLYYASGEGASSEGQPKRKNAFVRSFASQTAADCRFTCEALPFYPPMFLRMIEASIVAKNNLAIVEASEAKRRADTTEPDDSLKRAREETSQATQRDTLGEGQSKSDAALDLLELADDYGLAGVGAVPLPQDSILAAALEQQDVSISNGGSASGDSIVLVVTRKRQRPAHPILPSISLTPRDGPLVPGHVPLNAAAQVAALPSVPRGNLTNAVNIGIKSGKNAKKQAGSVSQFHPKAEESLQVSRNQLQGVPQGLRMKEAIRGRFLATSRQSGIGTSIFEAPAFRAAFVRIRHRLRNCTAKDCWHSSSIIDAGPGLPIQACKRDANRSSQSSDNRFFWTSLVKRLDGNGSATGDEAVLAANNQRSALRRSLSAPCRVDFGPFQSGFLSSPSGMTAIVPPRPRGGVSLPMGVKVPSPTKALHVPWTELEEKQLQYCILRFGTNWMLAARTLSGVQDVETVSRQSPGARPIPRAGRSCREHWHIMARNEPNLSRDLRQAERLQREKATHRFGHTDPSSEQKVRFERRIGTKTETSSGSHRAVAFFVPLPPQETITALALSESEVMGDSQKDQAKAASLPTTQKRRSFSAISAAKAMKVQLPRNIPGVQSGCPPTISPSHPSHMQAIQKSATSKWSGGRTDMWPIQFLDASDRHRKPQVPSNPQQRVVSTSFSRNHGTSSNNRQPYPPPPHRMPSAESQGIRGVPATSTRPSSIAATMQSFAPPSSRARSSDDKKPAPKK